MKIWTWVILGLHEPWYLNERVNREKEAVLLWKVSEEDRMGKR